MKHLLLSLCLLFLLPASAHAGPISFGNSGGFVNGTIISGNAVDDQVILGTTDSAAVWATLPSCSNGTTSKLLYNSTTNTWSCGTDQGGVGASILLDLADNGVDESSALAEIATSGDTNSIFTEPTADKLLITLSNDWPKADTADDLTCTDCIGPTEITDLALGTDTSGGYAGSATEAGPATTALALNANGANCTPGEAAGGVDASGAAEDCFAPAGTGDITRVAACLDGNCGIEGGNDLFPVLHEGTANTEETTISVTDPTADHTIAFPANSGTVAVAATAPVTLSATGVAALTQNAGTDVTADLEEETHATEHQDGGADEVALDGSQITTGTVANARTTAASANTASAIVARDVSGNFTAGTITATLTGTADLANDLSCTNCIGSTEITDLTLGTDTAGNYAGSASEAGPATTALALDANPTDCGANTFAHTIAANGSLTCSTVANAATTAASANTASAIVARDTNGDFVTRDIDLRKFLPTVGTTQFLQAGTAIDCSTGMWVQICGSSDGLACNVDVDLTVDPQILDGTKDGQICILLGTDPANTVTLDDGTGLHLREQRIVGADDDAFAEVVWLRWLAAGDFWEEVIPKGVQLGTGETLQQTYDASGVNPEIDVGANGQVFSDLTSATKSVRFCNADESVCGRIYVDATNGFTIDTNPASDAAIRIADTKDFFVKDSDGANIIAVDEATQATTFVGSLAIPNGAAPTVDAFAEIAGDNDLWAASRGAPIFYDGTASTALVNVLVSDVPTNGQRPTWNTGGTITWEPPVATLHTFRPQQNEPPATAFATQDTRNSHPILVFVDASDTSAVFSEVVNRGYAGGDIVVDIHSTSASAITGTYGWCAAVERIGTALDIDADSFATAKCTSTTVSGTTGILVKSSITFSNAEADAIAVGEGFRLKITRDGDGTTVTDSATDSANLRLVEVRQ